MPATASEIERGVKHLRRADPVLGAVIRRAGPFALTLRRNRFQSLVHAILSQQVSTGAARAIRTKLAAKVGDGGLRPEVLSALQPGDLRACGLSRQKASYVLDLATQVGSGRLPLERIGRLSDQAVIEALTGVKGIGEWTAHMFLIFSLGRLDVMPHGDYGVRSAIQKLYALDNLPDRATCHRIAEPWRPYASIGAWYCWRSLEF
jgi:DNA-3-methyladenine glycosylase II